MNRKPEFQPGQRRAQNNRLVFVAQADFLRVKITGGQIKPGQPQRLVQLGQAQNKVVALGIKQIVFSQSAGGHQTNNLAADD